MDTPGLTIYNLPQMPPVWDRVGVFYVSFAAIWTFVVLAGMAFCLYNRNLPMLRVRGLPLAFGSVFFLHLYWIMAQIVYPIGRTLPIVAAYDVQYFVMGIWFPLGIALFHASNLRFLRIARLQKRFAQPDMKRRKGCNGAHSSWLCKIRNMEYTVKVTTFITIGIIIQTLLCVGMWLACRKYHPGFGFPGTEIKGTNLLEQIVDLGRGWEWWPSVVWQFIWTWGVAPVLIWRAWNIRDTMGWRAQTIGACLSGLHATPMFLIASYIPAFSKINAYFPPSQWIHLNTMLITIFTVFVPAYQVIKLWIMTKQVNRRNSTWDSESQAETIRVIASRDGKGSISESIEKEQIYEYICDSSNDRLYTVSSLSRFLEACPRPLQEFSAIRDFSGENIAFLTHVTQWKATITETLKAGITGQLEGEHRIDCYNSALKIYIDFVSMRDAEFPLNLSSPQLKALEGVFEKSARILCGDGRNDSGSSFLFDVPPSRDSNKSDATETTLYARYTGEISNSFGFHIFDDAEKHIKDLVLTNTWPKFVKEMQAERRQSMDSERSKGSNSSGSTFVGYVAERMHSFF